MTDVFELFENITRHLPSNYSEAQSTSLELHPFDVRNIHTKFPIRLRKLFDDGHYTEATLFAYKFVEKNVKRLSRSASTGKNLMMEAFKELNPLIKLNSLGTMSERDVQEGFKFLFAGSTLAIRNPAAHEFETVDNPDMCLDLLSLATLLLKRLEESGFTLKS